MSEPQSAHLIAAASVGREQLRLLATQASRTLAPLMLADLFLWWILYSIGEGFLGTAWFISVTCMQVLRRRFTSRILAQMPPAHMVDSVWRRINALFLLIGLTRVALIPLSFQHHDASAKFFVSMMLIGMAAGGIASVAGNIKPFAMWAGPIFFALIVAWAVQGGVEGYSFAFLVTLMFAFILAAIRDQQRVLVESMAIREQNRDLLRSLESERDKARAASEAKTRFFAAASHDLRQPLHALSLHVATLDLIASDERTQRVSEQLNRSLAHANSLLEGLIDLSRLDANSVTPSIKPFALGEVLRSLDNEFRIDCEQHDLSLTFSEQPEQLWVRSDADLVLRILRNLLGNALKFTPHGGISVSVHAIDQQRVRLCVSDTGIGIAAAEQEKIFEEFYQIGNPGRDRSRGLGLGLSIVQRLSNMLELPLTLHSSPGAGTRFELVLPRAAAVPVEEVSPAGRDFSAHSLRVLIVDDEAPIVAALSSFLSEVGWTCAVAAGQEGAMQLMREGFAPDAMVLDVRLGENSGVDLALALRSEFGPIPVLFVTGESDAQRLEVIKQSGFPFITKPVDGPRLAHSISRLVEPEGD